MSSNHSNMSGSSWRQREIEKAKARKEADLKFKEEAEKKQYANTEKNFPSIIGAGAQMFVSFDHKFSTLASNWQQSDDMDVAREAYRREKARKARNEVSGVFIHRFREGRLANTEEEEEYYEDVPQPKVDSDGWEEIKKKARKTPHELTEAELAAKYEKAALENERDEQDVNSHLFDNRRRGELY